MKPNQKQVLEQILKNPNAKLNKPLDPNKPTLIFSKKTPPTPVPPHKAPLNTIA